VRPSRAGPFFLPRTGVPRAAVRLVTDRLADPDLPAHRVVVSPSLTVRESSAPPRAAR
jgi:DNA-binding LacI/PurR family transcriptional regulator